MVCALASPSPSPAVVSRRVSVVGGRLVFPIDWIFICIRVKPGSHGGLERRQPKLLSESGDVAAAEPEWGQTEVGHQIACQLLAFCWVSCLLRAKADTRASVCVQLIAWHVLFILKIVAA